MFDFLKGKHNSLMVFDPSEPDIDLSNVLGQIFQKVHMANVRKKYHPINLKIGQFSWPWGIFFYSDHPGNTIILISRTGFIIFLDNAPIYWFSKKHTSIDTWLFGSEFVAMKQYCE